MKDKEKDKRLLIPGDAFEEEASEGLGRLSREEAEADLRELKGRMGRRIARPRTIWLPAAAAVVILLVASTLYVSVFRERGPELPGIARSEREKSNRGAAADAEKKKGDSALIASSGEEIRDTALIAMAAPIEKKEDLSGFTESESRVRGDLRSSGSVRSARKTPTDTYTAENVVEEDPDAEAMPGVAGDLKREVVSEEISGVIVAQARNEEPAPDEVIVEALPMMRRAALRTADTSKASADESPDAVLKEKNAMREAAVAYDVARPAAVTSDVARPAAAGYDAVKPDPAVRDAAVQAVIMPDRSASPVGGWNEYREWMARNIRYPEGVELVERQVVQVSFTVKADSTLTDLKALSTPGESFTREAFRLLREGPMWQPAVSGGKATEEEVRVSIVFK